MFSKSKKGLSKTLPLCRILVANHLLHAWKREEKVDCFPLSPISLQLQRIPCYCFLVWTWRYHRGGLYWNRAKQKSGSAQGNRASLRELSKGTKESRWKAEVWAFSHLWTGFSYSLPKLWIGSCLVLGSSWSIRNLLWLGIKEVLWLSITKRHQILNKMCWQWAKKFWSHLL